MRISVVICTYNRSQSLERTLRSLEFQTHGDFEVVVVNGPSTDATDRVLAAYAGRVRVVACPHRNLAVSRNLGIDQAAGEVVAFIDDDSLATPRWLEELAKGYAEPATGGAGGLVYDHTGRTLQYRYSHCRRTGIPDFEFQSSSEDANRPGADPFVYLQGTNCSFRREALEQVRGFDEEYEYYLDETDLCMRVLDAGFRLAALDGAIVHHKYLASFLRTPERIVLDPYSATKNTHYFALQNHRTTPLPDVEAVLKRYVEEVRASAHWYAGKGMMTPEQRDFFLRRVDEGIAEGRRRGAGERKTRFIQPPVERNFQRFPTLIPEGERRTFCFISKEYPPGDYGGNGRHTFDLATGLAGLGHEVHVITNSDRDEEYVDIEQDVWVHRLHERIHPAVANHVLGGNLSLIARNYRELRRIHRESPVSLAIAPIWLCEGAMAACDPRFPTVMSLMTTTKVLADLDPGVLASAHGQGLIALEAATVATHTHAHAISRAIAKRVEQDYGLPRHTFVAPLGVEDLGAGMPIAKPHGDGDAVKILFVGRIERRKAVDVLLEAAVLLLGEFPQLEFHLVGKKNEGPDQDPEQTFRQKHPELLGRVKFVGAVDEAELKRHYLASDIFCLPSRYESLGLVLLEAMSMGRPVVASRVGGIPEVVDEGVTGLLFEADDVADLAGALRRLIADPALRRAMGTAARRRYEETFSLGVVIRSLLAHYAETIAEHRRSGIAAGEASDEILCERFAGVLARSLGDSRAPSAGKKGERPREHARELAAQLLTEPAPPEAEASEAYQALRASAPWKLVRRVFRWWYLRHPHAAMELRARLVPIVSRWAEAFRGRMPRSKSGPTPNS